MRELFPFQTIKPIIANISHDKKSKYRVSSCLYMSCPQPCFMSSWHVSNPTHKNNFTPQPSEIYLRNTQMAQHRKADTRLKHEEENTIIPIDILEHSWDSQHLFNSQSKKIPSICRNRGDNPCKPSQLVYLMMEDWKFASSGQEQDGNGHSDYFCSTLHWTI